jgi:polysaccharide export outer membrane protein
VENQDSGADSANAADYDLIRVNLSALYKGQFEQNLKLEPGDIINIPRADVFFVAGEVQAPGSFPLKDGTTLRQAISLAQGLTFKARSGDGTIFREEPESGRRQEIKIDIGAVMNGKKEDIPILANDVIIIPNSRTKSVGGAILMALGINSARLPMRY